MEEERSDAALIEAMNRRDESALSEVIARFGPAVLGTTRWLLKDEGLAEEAAQDTFVSLWKRPSAVDLGKGTLMSFLTGVARHKAIDRIRSAEKWRRNTASLTDALDDMPHLDDSTRSIDDRDYLVSALSRLSETQREAIVLAYLGGRTYREVATELGIPEGTAKTRLRDGLIALRRLLERRVEATA